MIITDSNTSQNITQENPAEASPLPDRFNTEQSQKQVFINEFNQKVAPLTSDFQSLFFSQQQQPKPPSQLLQQRNGQRQKSMHVDRLNIPQKDQNLEKSPLVASPIGMLNSSINDSTEIQQQKLLQTKKRADSFKSHIITTDSPSHNLATTSQLNNNNSNTQQHQQFSDTDRNILSNNNQIVSIHNSLVLEDKQDQIISDTHQTENEQSQHTENCVVKKQRQRGTRSNFEFIKQQSDSVPVFSENSTSRQFLNSQNSNEMSSNLYQKHSRFHVSSLAELEEKTVQQENNHNYSDIEEIKRQNEIRYNYRIRLEKKILKKSLYFSHCIMCWLLICLLVCVVRITFYLSFEKIISQNVNISSEVSHSDKIKFHFASAICLIQYTLFIGGIILGSQAVKQFYLKKFRIYQLLLISSAILEIIQTSIVLSIPEDDIFELLRDITIFILNLILIAIMLWNSKDLMHHLKIYDQLFLKLDMNSSNKSNKSSERNNNNKNIAPQIVELKVMNE